MSKPVTTSLTATCLSALLLCLGCAAGKSAAGVAGRGGSLARFALKGESLYVLSGPKVKTFDLSLPARPREVHQLRLRDFGLETLFQHGNRLYVGSRTGMYILDLTEAARPVHLGTHRHLYSCDPVVVQGQTAYVTLRSASSCRTGKNELQILDVSNPLHPRLQKIYRLTNPGGLGVDGRLLFVADGHAGLRIFRLLSPSRLQQVAHLPRLKAYDVIPHGGLLIVSATDGLYQYRYNSRMMRRLSRVPIGRGAAAAPPAQPPAKKQQIAK
jgi:hypothetical protein